MYLARCEPGSVLRSAVLGRLRVPTPVAANQSGQAFSERDFCMCWFAPLVILSAWPAGELEVGRPTLDKTGRILHNGTIMRRW